MLRAERALDAHKRVSTRMAPRHRARPEMHRHRIRRIFVVHPVTAVAAVQTVPVRPAHENVVAFTPIQLVRPRTTFKPVVAVLAPKRVRTAKPIQLVVAGSAGACVVAGRSSQNRHGCPPFQDASFTQVSP